MPVCYASEMEGRLFLFVLLETIRVFPLDFIGDAPREIFGKAPIKLGLPNNFASQTCVLVYYLFPHQQNSCPMNCSGSKGM